MSAETSNHEIPSQSLTDEQIESMLVTVMIGIITIFALYYFFIRRPTQNDNRQGQAQVQVQAQAQRTLRQQQQQQQPLRVQAQPPQLQNTISHDDNDDDDGVQAILASNRRTPPHLNIAPIMKQQQQKQPLSTPSATNNILNRLYHHEGIVPFRYTYASTYEIRSSSSTSATAGEDKAKQQLLINRKNRAKLFTKLFQKMTSSTNSSTTGTNANESGTTATTTTSNTLTPPPSKGSNIVISIPSQDHINCPTLQKVLFLLGTFYNVFVLFTLDGEKCNAEGVDYKEEKKRLDGIIHQLRYSNSSTEDDGDGGEKETLVLSEEIIPSHRIITTSSISSRIAFVRQLPKAEIIIDYEEECKTQLTRFGFKVILYKVQDMNNSNGVNSLGKELLGK